MLDINLRPILTLFLITCIAQSSIGNSQRCSLLLPTPAKIQSIVQASPEIDSVVHLLNGINDAPFRGFNNFGVYSVATESGPLILKISKAQAFDFNRLTRSWPVRYYFSGSLPESGELGVEGEHFAHYLSVHLLLGELGLAPRLRGLVSHEKLERLFAYDPDLERFSELAGLKPRPKDRMVGILMDEVRRSWPLTKDPDNPPLFISRWTLRQVEDVLREIALINRNMQRLMAKGAFCDDLQLVVSEDAHAYLIDLDPFRLQVPYRQSMNVDREVVTVLQAWERQTGLVVPGGTKKWLGIANRKRPGELTNFNSYRECIGAR